MAAWRRGKRWLQLDIKSSQISPPYTMSRYSVSSLLFYWNIRLAQYIFSLTRWILDGLLGNKTSIIHSDGWRHGIVFTCIIFSFARWCLFDRCCFSENRAGIIPSVDETSQASSCSHCCVHHKLKSRLFHSTIIIILDYTRECIESTRRVKKDNSWTFFRSLVVASVWKWRICSHGRWKRVPISTNWRLLAPIFSILKIK